MAPSRPLALAAAVAVVAGFGAPHAALAQELSLIHI